MPDREYPGLQTPPRYRAEFLKYVAPLIETLRKKGGQARPREVNEVLAERFNLSDEEREATNKNGVIRYKNQIAFARYYLVVAGYLDGSVRGLWKLTEKGRSTIFDGPVIDEIFHTVQEMNALRRANTDSDAEEVNEEETEEEDNAVAPSATSSPYSNHRPALLSLIKSIEPLPFEEFCAELLSRTGVEDMQTTPHGGDGGIDGTGRLRISEFVTITIAFQAKKRDVAGGKVSSGEIRNFRGAMGGNYEKGVFFTSTSFSRDAEQEARRPDGTEIELVDMNRILEICEDKRIGLEEQTILIPDLDFFQRFQKATT